MAASLLKNYRTYPSWHRPETIELYLRCLPFELPALRILPCWDRTHDPASFLIGGGADERTVASQGVSDVLPCPEVLYQVGKILALAVTSGNKYDILSYGFLVAVTAASTFVAFESL